MTFFPNQSAQIIRYSIATTANPAGGQYVRGKWVEGSPTGSPIPVMLSVQPASGEMMQTLAEGRRVESMYQCFASVQVFTTDPEAQMSPGIVATNRDEILWNGMVFEVIKVGNWQNNIISHFEFYMMREKEIPENV